MTGQSEGSKTDALMPSRMAGGWSLSFLNLIQEVIVSGLPQVVSSIRYLDFMHILGEAEANSLLKIRPRIGKDSLCHTLLIKVVIIPDLMGEEIDPMF